jgi:hypothetical protein
MFRVSVPLRTAGIGRRILSGRAVEILGWTLFVLSALGFIIVSSLRTGDLPGLAGGVLFLAGCLAFLLPLLRRRA